LTAVTLIWAIRYYSDYNPSFVEYRKLIDISDEGQNVAPFNHGFNFAFGMKNGPVDEIYGTLKAEYVTRKGEDKPDRKDISLRKCSVEDFNSKNVKYTEKAIMGLDCLSETEGIEIYGD